VAPLSDIENARRLVIKIGSALVVDSASGRIRLDWLHDLAGDVAAAKARGRDVMIVSSGSIALGRRVLDLPATTLSLEQSQAAAAVGQIRLARAYEQALAPYDITAAQVLLTLEDSANRRRFLNSRATFATLLGLGVVPIVNENDTVATDEIRFGDNDRLAAQVAVMAAADLLILLSDVDGLYTANPMIERDARHVAVVTKITPEIQAMAGDSVNTASRGGMKTKLIAARTATAAGCALVIMKGDIARPLTALGAGQKHTWFAATGDPQTARKNWINAMKPKGEVHIDAGAAKALTAGKSLLPAGVVRVTGNFHRGDAVAIIGPAKTVLAKGLVGYQSAEADAIKGAHSSKIADILGHPGRAAVIHRDDMVL